MLEAIHDVVRIRGGRFLCQDGGEAKKESALAYIRKRLVSKSAIQRSHTSKLVSALKAGELERAII